MALFALVMFFAAYWALDTATSYAGTIWGTLEVQAASNNSAFLVDIFYGTV